MNLSILYRGPLSSCNYGCDYCPFAKHTETDAEHGADAAALERFVDWVDAQDKAGHRISVFFTPWGEALVRRRYQQAIIRLTNLSHVDKVAIQTNLSCRLDWTAECNREKLGLWATYHPTQISRDRFLERCREADRRGVRYSVGVVGMKEHFGEIEALREALPEHTYLWVNAYKRVADYYAESEAAFLAAVDPLFPFNNVRHLSQGHACVTGESVFSVDGDGLMRRCHFVKTPIGNIYNSDWETALRLRSCENETCGCHIGYVHMPELGLQSVFGDGILERIPQSHALSPRAIPLPIASAFTSS